MGDIITLRHAPIDLLSDTGRQFVVDCTRAAEGLITDAELQRKYELSPPDWRAITKDNALMKAIQAERERRVLSGTAVREMSAKHLVKGPGILDSIMSDAGSNPRHKIEAFKELRTTATVGSSSDRTADTERFVIKIDLSAGGGSVETYDKEIKIDISSGDDSNKLITLEGGPDVYE
jgi:hypothetical protein